MNLTRGTPEPILPECPQQLPWEKGAVGLSRAALSRVACSLTKKKTKTADGPEPCKRYKPRVR